MVIQIVTHLPPAIDGVGDYALNLARSLRQKRGVNTIFVLGDDRWAGPDNVGGFRVLKVSSRSAKGLMTALEAAQSEARTSRVLLQLSPYGYASQGIPLWLLWGLKRWKAKAYRPQLITMFHELYAFGPPWRSAFWASAAQRKIIAGIAQLSDIAVTNIHQHQKYLEYCDPSKRGRIPVLATPSNVGEPSQTPDLQSRSTNMIVFGQEALRRRAYSARLMMQRACQELGITEIDDVGTNFEGIPQRIGDVEVRKHGLVEVNDLSPLLSSSMAGFVVYQRSYLPKSGVFESYCSHRLIPVVAATPDRDRSDADGIACGTHYLCVGGQLSLEYQSIADAAWNWYQGHSLESHARTFADMMIDRPVAQRSV